LQARCKRASAFSIGSINPSRILDRSGGRDNRPVSQIALDRPAVSTHLLTCSRTCGARQGCREVHSRRLFVGLGPLDHVDMPAVDALKQEDRGESVVEPRQLPGELHARRATTTDQPRLWLVIHVRIIGVRECRHGTGNIVRRAPVEATSVVGDRARVRRFRRIRSLRISGRPAQTAAALAGACGQAASHPRIGGTGVPAQGLSEQASN
jgi:hypothetical protein